MLHKSPLIHGWFSVIEDHGGTVVSFKVCKDMEDLVKVAFTWCRQVVGKHCNINKNVDTSEFTDPSQHANKPLEIVGSSGVKFR